MAILTAGILTLLTGAANVAAEAAGMKGDVNADGKFSVADVVQVQKWLLGMPGVTLADWGAADFDTDGVLDVFDLCLMKRALLGMNASVQKKMTREDFLALAEKCDELTWDDFAEFQGQDIGSGLFVMKYEIEEIDDGYILVCGAGMEGKPDAILLVTDGEGTESMDIRSEEFQWMLHHPFWWWHDPENDETNQAAAKTIGQRALEKMQQGFYAPGDKTDASEFMTEDMADIYEHEVFHMLYFIDEHTVLLTTTKGLLDVWGYLITDGTVTYSEGEDVSVPSYLHLDGDAVRIEWVGDDLYYFWAGT